MTTGTLPFLTTLYTPYRGSLSDNVNETPTVELRCFLPAWKGEAPGPRGWYPLTEDGFERAERDAVKWRDRFEVYLGILPRYGRGGTAAYLRLAGWIWADIDAGDQTASDALDLLAAGVKQHGLPHPHILVRSGGGVHAYWQLATPRACRERDDQERVRRIMVRLVKAIGGELEHAHACPKANDVARILRLPGTYNNKRKNEPRPVRLMRCLTPDESRAQAKPFIWWDAHLPAEPLPPPRRKVKKVVPATGEPVLLPATIAKLTTPAPEGRKHYTMMEVAVAARKQGLDESAIRNLAEQVGLVSGVPMDDYQQRRHLDGLVAWTMGNVTPEPSNGTNSATEGG